MLDMYEGPPDSAMRRAISQLRNYLQGGLTEEEHAQLAPEIQRDNRRNLLIFSAVTCLLFLTLIGVSFFSSIAGNNRYLYLSVFFPNILVFVVAKQSVKENSKLLQTDIYVFLSLLLIFGIWLGTVHIPDKPAVTFIAVLLITPVLFTLRPSRIIGLIVFYAVAFVIAANAFEPDWVARTDTLNACVYATISIVVSTYLTNVKFQRYLYASRAEYLSTTDLLTGLRNRNAFEREAAAYADSCEHSLHCIYLDANGLHEVNNAQGHALGDAMLKFIAASLQEEFGKSSTYRIGGDEFVAFIVDKSAAEVQRHITAFEARLEKEGHCCSLGYAGMQRPDIDVNKLINEAEGKMRAEKDCFYRQPKSKRETR